jgi:hypothetical protein
MCVCQPPRDRHGPVPNNHAERSARIAAAPTGHSDAQHEEMRP